MIQEALNNDAAKIRVISSAPCRSSRSALEAVWGVTVGSAPLAVPCDSVSEIPCDSAVEVAIDGIEVV
jgi:hypothetical protein